MHDQRTTNNQLQTTESGQVLVFTLALTAVILLITTVILSLVSATSLQAQRALQTSQADHLAEAGLERALRQLAADPNWTGEANVTLGAGTYTVMVTAPDPTHRVVRATGFVPADVTGATQTIRQITLVGTSAGTQLILTYAAQAGEGGLEMHLGSRVRGNVISNGPIQGQSSAHNQTITGSASSAGSGGEIERVFVHGDVTAHEIDRVITNGNATADILRQSQFVSGTGFWEDQQSGNTGTLVRTTITPPDPVPLPFTSTILDEIRAAASAGTTHSGNLTTSPFATTQLGPGVVTGNLRIGTGGTLILNGHVWVQGNVELQHSSTIQANLAGGGTASAVALLADGNFTANQGARFLGTTPILGISAGGNVELHEAVRGDSVLIAVSPTGNLDVHQGAVVRQASGHHIILWDFAEIPAFPTTIQIDLGSGTGGGTPSSWQIEPQTWHQVTP